MTTTYLSNTHIYMRLIVAYMSHRSELSRAPTRLKRPKSESVNSLTTVAIGVNDGFIRSWWCGIWIKLRTQKKQLKLSWYMYKCDLHDVDVSRNLISRSMTVTECSMNEGWQVRIRNCLQELGQQKKSTFWLMVHIPKDCSNGTSSVPLPHIITPLL